MHKVTVAQTSVSNTFPLSLCKSINCMQICMTRTDALTSKVCDIICSYGDTQAKLPGVTGFFQFGKQPASLQIPIFPPLAELFHLLNRSRHIKQ